ncbi:TnsA endonuclease N-terminal domain-containing protein [Paraburkholderia sp. BR14320]|uniref:TnsA endonuclease N-terminal domain-containing protein n=1 Tax=unclassified Paraburkholderia TaxID=2615204 RepID=UPI0034CD4650
MSAKAWQGTWRGQLPDGQIHDRARQIIRPSGGIVRGKFPSRKNGRMVHHEGLLELDAIYLFEMSSRIASYREQPITFCYPDGARLRRYTPDFELTLTAGENVLVEVKSKFGLEHDEVRHKLYCVAQHLHRSVKEFVVLDDGTLRQEPRQSNLRRIYHQAPRVPPSTGACQAALERFRHHFPMSIASGVHLLGERCIDPFSLLIAGLLRCDIDRPLTANTLLYLMEEDDAWFCIDQGHGI